VAVTRNTNAVSGRIKISVFHVPAGNQQRNYVVLKSDIKITLQITMIFVTSMPNLLLSLI